MAAHAPGPSQTHESVLRAIQATHPQRTHAWRLEMPMQPDEPVTARYYKPDEKAHLAFAPLMVSIDPHTLAVRSSRFWGEFAMTWLYDLHYSLLLDRNGRTAMGIIGMVLLASLASGLCLWWPHAGRFKPALAFKVTASRARLTYDLHKLAGLYGFVLLLVIASTGVLLELPGWFNPLIDRASPLFKPPQVESRVAGGVVRIALDDAVRIALARFPGAELRWIETPDGAAGTFRINLRQPDEPSRRFPRTNVWIDQYSGDVLAVRDRRSNSAGDTLIDWLHPLHSGEAFGMGGRILVLISGVLPVLLFATGALRWLQKRRSRRIACARRTNPGGQSRPGW